MTMYVGIGALGVLGLLGRRLAVAVVATASLAIAIAVHYGWLVLPRLLGLADPNQFFKLGYFFFAGSLLYLLGDGLGYRWPIAAALTALWVATFGTPVGWVVYLLAWPYLVIYLAQIPSRWAQRFGRYGDFSYGLYIYAFPIQQLLVWSRPWDDVHLYAAAAFCATLPFAVASWHLVEAPALQLKRRKIRPAVPAPG
jgi:peptidoglycan/LPS O-acetylase OafA/YrhL